MREATFARLAIRGRDAALATVTGQLERVRSGVGAVVLVEGVPGIGKSRLLAEAATLAGGMSFRVGAGAPGGGGRVGARGGRGPAAADAGVVGGQGAATGPAGTSACERSTRATLLVAR